MRRGLRSTVIGAAVVAAAAVPSTVSAQSWIFNSCSTPGVCGSVEAFVAASLLSVRVSNLDNIVGSALYTVQLSFAAALNPATPGTAFTPATTASLGGATSSIGATPANAWSFGGVGGSNILDLSSFLNVFIEGTAASPFRALPSDVDNGTWVTQNGYVQFSANMSGVNGFAGNSIASMGLCTDVGCAQGAALLTPEPTSLALIATGLAGVAVVRRRRKNNVA